MLTLYTYFRSSASYRVRIALNLKGLEYNSVPVHLLRDGGQQFSPEFVKRNPAALVPVVLDDALTISQSLAIIEYLEERHPTPPLLPADAAGRARIRALALTVACEIHPLNNLRVLRYLKDELNVADAARDAWYHHWIDAGFKTMENMLSTDSSTGRFCHGDTPTLADCYLVPQVFNAHRLKCRMESFPTISRIYEAAVQLPQVRAAMPSAQPDAED